MQRIRRNTGAMSQKKGVTNGLVGVGSRPEGEEHHHQLAVLAVADEVARHALHPPDGQDTDDGDAGEIDHDHQPVDPAHTQHQMIPVTCCRKIITAI